MLLYELIMVIILIAAGTNKWLAKTDHCIFCIA